MHALSDAYEFKMLALSLALARPSSSSSSSSIPSNALLRFKFVQEQLDTITDKRNKLSTEVTVLKTNIEKYDVELRGAKAKEKEAQKAITDVEKHIQKLVWDKQALEEKTVDTLSEQVTLEKGTIFHDGQTIPSPSPPTPTFPLPCGW